MFTYIIFNCYQVLELVKHFRLIFHNLLNYLKNNLIEIKTLVFWKYHAVDAAYKILVLFL